VDAPSTVFPPSCKEGNFSSEIASTAFSTHVDNYAYICHIQFTKQLSS
jgi:hypothetical protein